ncbi:dihydrofolate reductase [Lentilactobacillus sp. SPB1-3]|uniref:Dihydrofolate reductase n=1 Tax=Lentilactobacillus terminaliae TaxID=3003483 RepID=A0ACD5DC24_9LACO|nr:dihydrofolate reductase [Lentilactobacillus sp. SPB1-3]MCZ0977243.1 dihydrofolate reductase [Lentilactobacillus sp. SPB1-3]
MISFIWAEDSHGIIGNQGKLPWHLPDDMHFFKQTTMGHPIVAGSRTFHSFNRPLPGRTNYVISSKSDFPDGVQVLPDITSFLSIVSDNPETNYFVLGGANVFKQLMDQVDRLYRTKIDAEFSGDTSMPAVDYSHFKLVAETPGIVDEKNKYPHTFEIYDRVD